MDRYYLNAGVIVDSDEEEFSDADADADVYAEETEEYERIPNYANPGIKIGLVAQEPYDDAKYELYDDDPSEELIVDELKITRPDVPEAEAEAPDFEIRISSVFSLQPTHTQPSQLTRPLDAATKLRPLKSKPPPLKPAVPAADSSPTSSTDVEKASTSPTPSNSKSTFCCPYCPKIFKLRMLANHHIQKRHPNSNGTQDRAITGCERKLPEIERRDIPLPLPLPDSTDTNGGNDAETDLDTPPVLQSEVNIGEKPQPISSSSISSSCKDLTNSCIADGPRRLRNRKQALPSCLCCTGNNSHTKSTSHSQAKKSRPTQEGQDLGTSMPPRRNSEPVSQSKPKGRPTSVQRFSLEPLVDLGTANGTDDGEPPKLTLAYVPVPLQNGKDPVSNSNTKRQRNRLGLSKDGVQVHACPECGKIFPKQQGLAGHIRVHYYYKNMLADEAKAKLMGSTEPQPQPKIQIADE